MLNKKDKKNEGKKNKVMKENTKKKEEDLKETQTVSIYWFYLLQNHVDTSIQSK